MKQITVKIPEPMLKDVHELLPTSRYTNRSDLMRCLLRDWVNAQRLRR